MKKIMLKLIILLMIGGILSGCGARGYRMETDEFVPHKFPMDQYHQKVDNFLVILDASSSMMQDHKKVSKFYVAKNTIYKMNLTIPDLNLTAGLRYFSKIPIPTVPETKLVYGMTQYTKEGFNDGLEAAKWAGGSTPLAVAINAGTADLKSTQGNTAVIIVSDGEETDGSALDAAKAMKKAYSDRLCIYTVVVGAKPKGKVLMKKIADLSGCGFSANADDLATSEGMADFVEKVFLAKAVKVVASSRPDSDGDGVYDDADKCPDTPAGVKVDADGCPLDSDGDGIADYLDKCPGTPKGAEVDERGCWTLGSVLFDFDKWDIKKQFAHLLDKVVGVLKKNPYLKLKLEGHTCNIGPESYNQKLSEQRASSVKTYLEAEGIEPVRLDAVGYGETQSAYSNGTRIGRAKNRRVELTPED